MKQHAIIPIFIPHAGCPHQCAFCNQRTITAQAAPPDPAKVQEIIESHLDTLCGRGLRSIEAAFYGGSFTGLPMDEQSALLEVAETYKNEGRIDKIRLSTRPDYIDDAVLRHLRHHSVDVIGLGVQSFDEDVLAASWRGHTVEDIYHACRAVQEAGFTLGIQLMIGLPKDTPERAVESARRAASLHPAQARLYPAVVLEGTPMARWLKDGRYLPMSMEVLIDTTAAMYRILEDAGIRILRVGLKSTDLINGEADLAHHYHPAFRQLVEGRLAHRDIENQLAALLSQDGGAQKTSIDLYANPHSFNAMVGHKACNRTALEQAHPDLIFSWKQDAALADHQYRAVIARRHQ